MASSPENGEMADDATRISRRFLASLREGDIGSALIQITALDEITPRTPRLDLNELEARDESEAGQ